MLYDWTTFEKRNYLSVSREQQDLHHFDGLENNPRGI
jgi:hypothetical protein